MEWKTLNIGHSEQCKLENLNVEVTSLTTPLYNLWDMVAQW